jgi:RNA polymerase sigma-70 factor (ECF subfamily)
VSDLPDEVLVERYKRDPGGPEARAAARELFERYRERVFLWCARRLRDEDQAVDLAQEVLVSAYRGLGAFEGRALYSTWVYTIMRNRCHRAMRRVALLRDEDADPDAVPDTRPDPAATFEQEEEEERLLQLMEAVLDPRERRALWLRCFERLPVDEVTRRLGLTSTSGARSVLQSARRKLRAALDRRSGEEGACP